MTKRNTRVRFSLSLLKKINRPTRYFGATYKKSSLKCCDHAVKHEQYAAKVSRDHICSP